MLWLKVCPGFEIFTLDIYPSTSAITGTLSSIRGPVTIITDFTVTKIKVQVNKVESQVCGLSRVTSTLFQEIKCYNYYLLFIIIIF